MKVIGTSRELNNFNPFYLCQKKSYLQARKEIRAGKKTSHWVWFVFPQLALHGRSKSANYFGIKSLCEAQAYLENPILGVRLIEMSTEALKWLKVKPIEELMGSKIDSLKLLSSATLFCHASKGKDCSALFEDLKKACQDQLCTEDALTEEFCVQEGEEVQDQAASS